MKPNRLKTALLATGCWTACAVPLAVAMAAAAAAPAVTAKCVGPDCIKTDVRKSKDQIEPGDRNRHLEVKPVGEHGGTKQTPVETAPAEHH